MTYEQDKGDMKINLEVKFKEKKHFIKREIFDIQINSARFPIDIIRQNFNEMTERMIEKLGQEIK